MNRLIALTLVTVALAGTAAPAAAQGYIPFDWYKVPPLTKVEYSVEAGSIVTLDVLAPTCGKVAFLMAPVNGWGGVDYADAVILWSSHTPGTQHYYPSFPVPANLGGLSFAIQGMFISDQYEQSFSDLVYVQVEAVAPF